MRERDERREKGNVRALDALCVTASFLGGLSVDRSITLLNFCLFWAVGLSECVFFLVVWIRGESGE